MDSATSRKGKVSSIPRTFPDFLDPPGLAVSVSAMVPVAVLYALLGPMGMEDQLDVLRRLAFVGSACALCWPFCHAFCATVQFTVRNRPRIQAALANAAGTAFLAAPCSAVAVTLYGAFVPVNTWQDDLLEVYANVLLLLGGCSVFVHYVARQHVKIREARSLAGGDAKNGGFQRAPAKPGNLSRERFFARLPANIGEDVIYLSVSGHYLSVVTPAGSALVLMRLADAVAALGELGMQVHRSHWVAHRHVLGTIRRDDRTLIRVTGPRDLPVSRTYLANVRDAVPGSREQRSRSE